MRASCLNTQSTFRLDVVISRITLFVVLVLVACSSALAQTEQIAGRVTDGTGSMLPGVRVTVDGPGLHGQAITDPEGKFAVQGFLTSGPAPYRVVAELRGFETANITVTAGSGSTAPLNIRMRVGCLAIYDEVISDLHQMIHDADIVALVLLDSIEVRKKVRFDDSYCGDLTTFSATVTETVKDRSSPPVTSIQFVMFGSDQFQRGDFYIAILKRKPGTRIYTLMSRGYFVPVRSGLVEWPNDSVKTGPVTDVVAALRSITSQP